MGVFIKGIKIPDDCWDCYFFTADDECYFQESKDTCPLVEVKEPHGRLIDADEPMTKISTMMQEPDYQHEGENWMVGLIMARDAIDEASTVIEVEGEKDGR